LSSTGRGLKNCGQKRFQNMNFRCAFVFLFLGQRPLVPLLLLGPPFFPIILFGSTTLLTGMTGISLHIQWPLTSQLHGSVSQREQLFFLLQIKLHTHARLYSKMYLQKCEFQMQAFIKKCMYKNARCGIVYAWKH
jgi:hypothetical protein